MAASELGRRLVHAAGGFPVGLYLLDLLDWPGVRLLYLVGIVLAVALEAVRLLIGVDWWIYRELTREYEQDNPAGYALYVVGAAVVALAFAPRIAVPAVLMLAVVDPVSGVLSSDERRPVKRPRVLAVSFLLAGLLALPFVPLGAAVAGAALATAADGATPVVRGYVVDDNLGIPVGAAVAMWAALQLPL
ncbi:MAG: dolichol kinase [Halobacteriales archaeon]|nr:dolichol kinase [Halobacteriales archaeon]